MTLRSSMTALLCSIILGALTVYYFKAPASQQLVIEPVNEIASELYYFKELLSIDVEGRCTVYVTQAEGTGSLRVEADKAFLPYIHISIKDKQLLIRQAPGLASSINIPPATFYLFIPDIASLTVHGNSKIIVENELSVDSLDLNARGNATIQATIHTKELDIESHGASIIYLKGSTFEQYLQLNGSSRYEAFELESQECSINASGAAFAQLYVTELFHGTLNGDARVQFLGNSKNKVILNGSSKLTRKQEDQKDIQPHQ